MAADPQTLWTAVDAYFNTGLIPPDPALTSALERSRAAGLPSIAVAENQGRLLNLLASLIGAKRILEVGTLGGYSTIWMGRALPPNGRLISLEVDPKHVEVARANIAAAGLSDRVEVKLGRGMDLLPTFEDHPPFDLVFIDADKPSNADYFAWAMKLVRPGGLIIVDNVGRSGAVADAMSTDANVLGVRRLVDAVAAEPRAEATVLQTVGDKGHDGLMFIRVRA
jgi:predicted O-methyltransferase YrrM